VVEEEVEHAERMATWAAINDLANNDAEHGKRKLFIPLVSPEVLVSDFLIDLSSHVS